MLEEKFRSYCLICTAVSLNAIALSSIIFPKIADRPVADFKFPQQIKLKEESIDRITDLASTNSQIQERSTTAREILQGSQKYKSIEKKTPVELKISYLVNTRGEIDNYLHQYTDISPDIIKNKQVSYLPNIGHHALLKTSDRAYLSSCISPRSSSNVTYRQFSAYRYQNDLNWRVAWQWLRGTASIRDRRCLWVHLSTPITSDPQTAYRTLEATWQELYFWWLPNFPDLTD